MKIREDLKEILLRIEIMGLLMNRMRLPHTTLIRWVTNDYKDLRLPENSKVLSDILGVPVEEIFVPDDTTAL
ncbi:MAG: hypothetical protein LBE36_13335 [Flavobacteriaceae bacterium]|jgi:hypothetical protein|nr:hypothetical protein [Flavobacteriaceae bacterium]